MKKILILIILSISLVIGSGDGFARGWYGGGGGWHRGGWYGNGWRGNGWGGNDWVGAAIGLGALAIILNQQNGYYNGNPYDYGYYAHCEWVPGHYDYYGYWIRSHRACWR